MVSSPLFSSRARKVLSVSWPSFWTQTTWQTQLLRPLGGLVCWVAQRRLKRFLQQPPQTPAKTLIIVVGNIVVGGSGKTPFIQWLVLQCQAMGLKVGIVSRGYGGQSKTWPLKVTAKSDPKQVGDEPVLLALSTGCSVAVSPKRPDAIDLLLLEDVFDVIISDDGLQHFAMGRDLEIVLMDAQRNLGNGYCLPAGPLREPTSRLETVDFVVYNGATENASWQMHLLPVGFRKVNNPKYFMALSEFVTTYSEVDVTAMAGIGNPQRFFKTLRDLGLSVTEIPLKDHHAFNETDFTKGLNLTNPIIMTHKDAVKCREFAPDQAWYLEVSPQCSVEFAQVLQNKIQTRLLNKQAV